MPIFLIRRFNLDLLACKKIYMHAYRSGFFVRVVYRVVHVAHRVDEAVRIDIVVHCDPKLLAALRGQR